MHGINLQSVKDDIIVATYYEEIMDACEVYKEEKDPIQFEKELTTIQTKIEKQKKQLGYNVSTKCDRLIENEIGQLTAKYKTVDGVEFASIEEAKAAKKDLKKYYECISICGIESENLQEEIKKLEFTTDIVTGNLDERLTSIKALTDDKEFIKRIKAVFKKKGFQLGSNKEKASFAEKAVVIGTDNNFIATANRVRKLVGIPSEEKIVLIFRNEKEYEDDFTWWVLTTDNLYLFENDDDTVENKKVVPFWDIEFVHVDYKGNFITRINGGVDRTTNLELNRNCDMIIMGDNLTKALEEVMYLIAPLSKGYSNVKKAESGKKKDTVELNVKTLKNNVHWVMASSNCESVKEHACMNDNSSEFKELLNKAKQYWNCEFDDETIYFVMVDSSIGSSVVLTSVRCYIYGKVGSKEQKFVFPIEKTSNFQSEGKRNEYCMFFDVDYFKENYFNCSGGGVCFNTIKFKMYNIPEDAGKSICHALTALHKQICRPMLEKEEAKKSFQKAIAEADDNVKISALIKEIKKDVILDKEDKEVILEKAQAKQEQYQNSISNSLLEKVNGDELSSVNAALNQILSNKSFDEIDNNAILKLIEMQLVLGSKLYKEEIDGFFPEKSSSLILLKNQPVYMKKWDKGENETAEKIRDFFTSTLINLGESEVPLLLFKMNPKWKSEYIRTFGDETCLVTNKRWIILERGKTESWKLEELNIEEDTLIMQVLRSKNGKLIPCFFPFIRIDKLEDKSYRKSLREMLTESEYVIVTKELTRFVAGVHKKTLEKIEKQEILSKLPTDTSVIKSFSKEQLEKEYAEWKKHTQYGSQVANYVSLVEGALKEAYQKEADALCTGLESMSINELEILNNKWDKEFSNKQFASLIEKNKAAVKAELQKKKDMAVREEIAANISKLDSFAREELESEYSKWIAYYGGVTEVKEYVQNVREALERIYKSEAVELCSGLESLSVKELNELLSRFDEVFDDPRFADCVKDERNSIVAEIERKKDMETREEAAKDAEKLPSLSSVELKQLSTKWTAYTGKVPEVETLVRDIQTAFKVACKKEAQEMCAGVETLSVREVRQVLSELNKTFTNKEYIKDEIALVKNVLISKQEQEIKEWLPEELDLLSVAELDSYIAKFSAENYETVLCSKYRVPLLEKRDMLLAQKAEELAIYIDSKAPDKIKYGCLTIESKENILKDLKRHAESGADPLVCSLGTANDICYIHTKKITNNQLQLLWNEIAYFEFKKKLFGSSLMYYKKNGMSGNIKVSVPSDQLPAVADILNAIHTFVMRNGFMGETAPMKSNTVKNSDMSNTAISELQQVQGGKVARAETPVIKEQVASPMVHAQNSVQNSAPEAANREEEYAALRPLMEPIMPALEAHVAKVKSDFTVCKVMRWDGEAEVIKGEKAPILAALRDTNCSPSLKGEKAIDSAKLVFGILPEFFYMVNLDKFILYVKGQKYEWKVSDIRSFDFKETLLSSTLIVCSNSGLENKIKVGAAFYRHFSGLRELINFLKQLNKSESVPGVAS